MNATLKTLEDPAPGARDASRQYVTFQLADESYAIAVEAIQEVLRVGEIAPVPGSAADVLGVMNLRGDIVPVIDGRIKFGKPRATVGERARMLVLPTPDGMCAMQVDCVEDVIDIAAEEAQPLTAQPHRKNSPVDGVAWRGDGFVALVDPAALLERGQTTGETDGNR
jgi:purine-binding chemotaxis protein CheW